MEASASAMASASAVMELASAFVGVVGFGRGGGVEDFFGGSEDSVDGEGDFFFFVVGAVFLEAGGLVVFFFVVEEASSQVMVTASVAVCRSVWILGIPVSLVAFSMPTREAGSR